MPFAILPPAVRGLINRRLAKRKLRRLSLDRQHKPQKRIAILEDLQPPQIEDHLVGREMGKIKNAHRDDKGR
jgi:hypothetical protein